MDKYKATNTSKAVVNSRGLRIAPGKSIQVTERDIAMFNLKGHASIELEKSNGTELGRKTKKSGKHDSEVHGDDAERKADKAADAKRD